MSLQHAQTAVCAADLAERIVDRISESNQDWGAIERDARELVALLSWHNRHARGHAPPPRRSAPYAAGRNGAAGATPACVRARAARTAAPSVTAS